MSRLINQEEKSAEFLDIECRSINKHFIEHRDEQILDDDDTSKSSKEYLALRSELDTYSWKLNYEDLLTYADFDREDNNDATTNWKPLSISEFGVQMEGDNRKIKVHSVFVSLSGNSPRENSLMPRSLWSLTAADSGAKIESCIICNKKMCEKKLKHVIIKTEKVFLFTARVLQNLTSIEQAKRLLYSNSKFNVCHSHFRETIQEFFKILEIKCFDGIFFCFKPSLENLLNVVRSVYPDFEITETSSRWTHYMKNLLRAFVRKNDRAMDYNEKINSKLLPGSKIKPNSCNLTNRVAKGTVNRRRCGICSRIECIENLKKIIVKRDLVLILTAQVLLEKMSISEARHSLFLSCNIYICQEHLLETVEVIYNILGVKCFEEISQCFTHSLQGLLTVVQFVYPEFEITPYSTHWAYYMKNILKTFVKKNMNYLK